MTALRFLALSATCLALASCENTKKSSGSDPYASNYGNDGHYNPYPGQSGYATSSTPKYQTPPASSLPPPPEPPANPYAFSGTKKATPSTSSHSTTPKKTVASSSSAKKKTTTSSKSKTSSKKPSGSKYTVVKGDTLSAIARKRGSSVAKIKAANGLSSDLIRLGQSLKIP